MVQIMELLYRMYANKRIWTHRSDHSFFLHKLKELGSTCLCFRPKNFKKIVFALFEECVSLGGRGNDKLPLYSS